MYINDDQTMRNGRTSAMLLWSSIFPTSKCEHPQITVLLLSFFQVASTCQRHSVAPNSTQSRSRSESERPRTQDGYPRGRSGGHCHLLRPHPICGHLGCMEEQGFWGRGEFGPEREHHGGRERHWTLCGRVHNDRWVWRTCADQGFHLLGGWLGVTSQHIRVNQSTCRQWCSLDLLFVFLLVWQEHCGQT